MRRFLLSFFVVLASLSLFAEDVTTWGYVNKAFSKLETVGVGQVAFYSAAISVPTINNLKDAQLTAINIPLVTLNISSVSVWVKNSKGQSLVSQQVTVDDLIVGYNKIALSSPITISEPLIVGYTFKVRAASTDEEQYPLLIQPDITPVAGTQFAQFGTTASASMQLEEFPYVLALTVDVLGYKAYDYNVEMVSMDDVYALPGETVSGKVNVLCNNGKAVTNVNLELEIDGAVTTQTAALKVNAGVMTLGAFNIEFVAPDQIGDYTLNVKILKVNGEANAQESTLSVPCHVVSRKVVRRSVVEEFTGVQCPNCPRGMAGMKYLRDKFGDRFIGIAVHQYSSSDAMYSQNYSLGLNSAPSCRIDRGGELDPYFGSSNEYLHIGKDFEKANAVAAPVDVTVTGAWTDLTRDSVMLTATATSLVDDEYTILFVLTADNLVGTGTAWKQTNNLYMTAPVGEPYLDEFLRGGQYGKSAFLYPFDDVMIGSSFKGTVNKAPAIGRLGVDESKTVSYTVAMPTKKTLRDAVNASLDKVYGVAIVLHKKSGRVANANRVHITHVTAMPSVSEDAVCQKVLIDGQLQIRRGDNIYDALGRIVK